MEARLELSGLTVIGSVAATGMGALSIEHSTLAPHDTPSILAAGEGTVGIELSFAIVGSIHASTRVSLSAGDSIIDGLGGDAIGTREHPVGDVDLERVTVLGATTAHKVIAENSIFTAPLVRLDPHLGVVRFSYVPPGSATPARVNCYPPDDDRDAVGPQFTSTRWGAPGYGQLALRCPPEIAAGADERGEMGAFNFLQQPTRFARMAIVLKEMLPAGVAASVNYRN
jgi:hypothetical protein